MSDSLLPCPICGNTDIKVQRNMYQDQLNPYDDREPMGLHDEATCGDRKCWMSRVWIPVKQWNRRPAASQEPTSCKRITDLGVIPTGDAESLPLSSPAPLTVDAEALVKELWDTFEFTRKPKLHPLNPSDGLNDDEKLEAIIRKHLRHSAPREGWVMVSKEPPEGLLVSMAMRQRHDFGLLSEEEQRFLLAGMRKAYEEISGEGFYSAEREGEYLAALAAARSPNEEGEK